MKLIATIIGAIIHSHSVIGSNGDRNTGSVHGVVVADAYGNKPKNVRMLGTSGVSLRTDNGEVVSVFVRRYDLMPTWALGWGVGDTLTISGIMEMQGETHVFHNAIVQVTSPNLQRLR